MRQLGQIAKPGVVKIIGQHLLFLAGLRIIPVEIGAIHIFLGLTANAAHIAARDAHQHTASGEERHLRVVAHRRLAFGIKVKFSDATVAIAGEDAVAAHKFHGIAQRIACRTGHQRTTNAVVRAPA